MSELRWNPQLRQWVIVASHRQDRTYKPPAAFCPLCPTKPDAFPTEVPASDYEIVVFENKFSSLQTPAPEPGIEGSSLFLTRPAEGICEVVLYSSDHNSSLASASVSHIDHLIQVWTDRYRDLCQQEAIEYVLIFENKGEAVGVTLHHPHGQIYALPFIPPVIQQELASAHEHRLQTGSCLYCTILAEETKCGQRMIAQNSAFAAFIPFFARYPFEVHIYSKRHLGALPELTDEERCELAGMLKQVITSYDGLFGFSLPYMMIMHQNPAKNPCHDYHFHFEFYPLHRTENKLKHLAGVESGAGTFITDMSPEQQAAQLRGE